jgi:hypothetical protein
MVGEPALPPGAGFAVELVDQVDDVEDAAADTAADAGAGDADSQVGLARAGAADQPQIALMRGEAAGGELAYQSCVDRRAGEGDLVDLLGPESGAKGSLATVSWYFIERACFSLSSAASRSPTIRCGSCWRFTAVATISSLRVGVAGPATRGRRPSCRTA